MLRLNSVFDEKQVLLSGTVSTATPANELLSPYED